MLSVMTITDVGVFFPPFPWKELSFKNKKTAAWLTRHYHGLRWDSGELPYSSLELILTSLFASYNIIYTKGLEKNKFFREKIRPKNCESE